MKQLDFNPHKSKKIFRKNYKLHDHAERIGKNLLVQWGIEFDDFGKDLRYQKLWEKGKDKPDLILKVGNNKFLLDWKSKHKPNWLLNKRAYDAYKEWGEKLSAKVIIAFFLFDDQNILVNRKFAVIGKHQANVSIGKQWDKNETVEFTGPLPDFTKANIFTII